MAPVPSRAPPKEIQLWSLRARSLGMSSAPKCATITISKACGTPHRRTEPERTMRLTILAIGHGRGTSEGALCDEFQDRAIKIGRNMGFTAVNVEELAAGKARDTAIRMADEAARLAAKLPDGAHIVLLDARGKGMISEDFAEMLG